VRVEEKPHRLLFEAVVAGFSAPLVFWGHVPIFVLSLSKTPVFLILLTFVATLFFSLPSRVYRLGFFRLLAALYLLCVFAYQAFVSYGIFGLGWWRFLLFAVIAMVLGIAVSRWSVAAWGIFVVVPLAAKVSSSLAVATAIMLLPVTYRFFTRREALLASLFVYSFLTHLLLFGFFKLPVVERQVGGAEIISVRSSLGRVQPADLEVSPDGEILAASYTSLAVVLFDFGSGEVRAVFKELAGPKRVGVDLARGIAVGSDREKRRVVVFDIEGGRVASQVDLGLRVDYAGFLGARGFVADSKRGVVVFFDPSSISVERRVEIGRQLSDVCTCRDGMIVVASTGEVFAIDPGNLEARYVTQVPGFFWFSCSRLGAGDFAVLSPTRGKVVLVSGGRVARSFYAGSGVWTTAKSGGFLYVGNLFSGRVKVYSSGTLDELDDFKLCRRLRSLAASDGTLFASTRCGLLKSTYASVERGSP